MPKAPRNWHAVFERGEQLAFVALNVHLLVKFWPGLFQAKHVILTLYVLYQTMVVLFLLFRRSAQHISPRPSDHVVATVSTILPLLALPPTQDNILPLPLLLLIFAAGTVLHLGAKLTLRRSFGILPANRGIKTGGVYRIVRHPMYLGYLLVELSLVLAGPLAWNIAILLAGCLLFGLRIFAEERLLGQSPDYRELCRTTRYRLIPGVY